MTSSHMRISQALEWLLHTWPDVGMLITLLHAVSTWIVNSQQLQGQPAADEYGQMADNRPLLASILARLSSNLAHSQEDQVALEQVGPQLSTHFNTTPFIQSCVCAQMCTLPVTVVARK